MRRWALLPGFAMLLQGAIVSGPSAADSGAPAATESPAQCSSYAVGTDTHTECTQPAGAHPGQALKCQSYTVGADTHTDCAPVAVSDLSALRGRKAGPVPPSAAPRCYTYHIGSSAYTDCR